MSFRKRNVGLSSSVNRTGDQASSQKDFKDASIKQLPGVRPSPVDGRPTTSTGAQSFDDLLGGHAGLALGNSVLIEENGTTDFAGALLRYYAAEGVVQGHKVHVVGVPEQWGRELPGVVGTSTREGEKDVGGIADKEKMKIAWRYERLGEFGAGARAPITPNRNPNISSQETPEPTTPATFCHSFDLTKRLTIPQESAINFISISHNENPSTSPYTPILTSLSNVLTSTPQQTIHRLILPTLLSPALYPPHSSNPTHLLPFLHSLRSLLRTHSTRLTTLLTLPLSLHPRSTGLVCWIEQLCDGVVELSPFPYHIVDLEPPSSGVGKTEEKLQGMVRVHRLPVLSEKGCGSGGGDDLAFSLSRKRFIIKPYSLPPMDGDSEAQRGEAEGGKVNVDVDF
ncbi:Elongator subunit elp4 [Lecanora helva]